MNEERRPSQTAARLTAETGTTPRRLTRRHLEIALGALWFVDGLLQLQPFMFTREFYNGVLGMANMGLPGPVAER